ncbi:MAG: hypothetical protein GY868_04740, partial [Deltaproteobacteria bacterium]|nr:hypothetical protein [Deltaproteobacteria bacterium]
MDMLKSLINSDDLYALYHPEAVAYLFVVLVVFYVGKKVFDLLTPFQLNE